MVSASSEVQQQHIDSLWSITQVIIGFGAVACMCCVLFLGLKFKWFRAQFKVQDMPKTKKSSDTVQGIGFKIKSNTEDFQQYKSISEFATPDANINSIPSPNNKNSSNDIPQKQKVTIMNEAKPNTSAKVVNKNKVPSSEKLNVNTETPSISIPTTKKKTEVFEETSTKREIRSQITTQESNEYNSKTETEIKTSEKKEKKSKVTFAKNKTVQQTTTETEHEQIENIQVRSEENTSMQQMRKPLSAQDIVMPQEDEDNWQIRIVGEKQKVQIDNRHDDIYYEEIRLANDNNSNSISNSMYSSQAASIFFGSCDEKQLPDSPPPPIPRKFLEDDDAISMSSQTSA